MRNIRQICAAIAAVTLVTGSALAGDRAVAVPSATLNSMGFGSARVMSDTEGAAVRGRGYFAFAKSVAKINSQTKVRVDFAPPGHAAYTHAALSNGTLFAGGSSFAYAK